MSKPTIAICGLGYWGQKLLHRFQKLDCTVKWIVDPDPGVRATYGKAGGILYPVSTLGEALEQDPSIDAVVIATPASTHYDLARTALMADKHVLCEKPLVFTAAEAKILYSLLKPDQVLMPGLTYLHHPLIKMFARQASDLGVISLLDSWRVAPTTPRGDCSVIQDLLPHDVSIFNHILAARQPRRVNVLGDRECATVQLEYGPKTKAYARLSWHAPRKVRTISIHGSEGVLSMDETACPPDPEPLLEECRHFLASVAGTEQCLTDADASVAIVRTVEAAELSLRCGHPVAVGGGV